MAALAMRRPRNGRQSPCHRGRKWAWGGRTLTGHFMARQSAPAKTRPTWRMPGHRSPLPQRPE
eukprot:6688356-Pyramimonas_sp.AAC.1